MLEGSGLDMPEGTARGIYLLTQKLLMPQLLDRQSALDLQPTPGGQSPRRPPFIPSTINISPSALLILTLPMTPESLLARYMTLSEGVATIFNRLPISLAVVRAIRPNS